MVDNSGTTSYIYNRRGLLASETRDSVTKGYSYDGNGTTLYSYDLLGRMTGMQNGDTAASYTYDGNGIRQSKTVDGVTTSFVLDGVNVVKEGSTYYSRGLMGLISRTSGSNTDYYYMDYYGSVVKCGDSVYNYDAFGNQSSSTDDTNPFRYCGEYTDLSSGLIYLRNRYYDPATSRMLSEGYNPKFCS